MSARPSNAEMCDGLSSQGNDANADHVKIIHWCWIPAPPGQMIAGGYVVTRCEGAPLHSHTVRINVLWQFSWSRGTFWAPEATAQDPATSYQTYMVQGVIPRLDPTLFADK